jgi:hypothetical protein
MSKRFTVSSYKNRKDEQRVSVLMAKDDAVRLAELLVMPDSKRNPAERELVQELLLRLNDVIL